MGLIDTEWLIHGFIADIALLLAFKIPLTSSNILRLYPVSIIGLLLTYSIYCVIIYPRFISRYRHLPQPPNPHWLFGSFADYGKHYYDHGVQFHKQYPDIPFANFRGPFGKDYLTALSPEAHLAILQTHVYKFPKPAISQAFKVIIGNGLVFAEGDEHRQQKKALLPAFAYSHIKSFVPIFMNKCKLVMQQFDDTVKSGSQVFAILPYLSRLTLDAIGEASFGVNFNSINDGSSELLKSYEKMSNPTSNFLLFNLFALVPGWRYVPLKYNNEIRHAQGIFRENCRKVLEEKQEALLEQKQRNSQSELKDRNILSILLNSGNNWALDEVENQIMTFLFAGHETTAGAVTWALFTMAQNQDIQERLRTEIRENFPGGVDAIQTAEAIESAKYLNNVVRECLRLNPPVLLTTREAAEDVTIEGLEIKKGTVIQISIKAMNTSTKFWGQDANDFNPDRWNGRQAESAYANLTFIQGTRSCIGKRFAEIEFKCILAALVGRYRFEEATKNQNPEKEFVITIKPLDGLPLKVTKIDGW
ncbi:cytochrome P450 [Lipomyces japonicus]|uniref:cytochrome P450 n=1 Tax=Lipomyces japonicus TaxID=56871 RepID=UPI0034CE2E80